MSENFKTSNISASTPVTGSAAEASVRQLIANGKDKTAVERAKDIHKTLGTPESEALLIDAYLARIQSLIRQNLATEASALVELVGQRYPSARVRLEELANSAALRSGMLDEVLRPLGDPSLQLDRRAAIERLLEQEAFDLTPIASCKSLSPDHPLRMAASALHRAFVAVTSGPVSEEALALPEVSRRSPLAAWKLLVRAIACLHRNEDEACRQYLELIKPDSVPGRLVPAMRKMVGVENPAGLSGPVATLISSITGPAKSLRQKLEELERAFADGKDSRILESIRSAVREYRAHAPGDVERLQQYNAVRCAVIDLDKDKATSAMGGPARRDAAFLRLLARGLELSGEPEKLIFACHVWNHFRTAALEEGWFRDKGVEVAALYLHMASVLRQLPAGMAGGPEFSRRSKRNASGEDLYFLDPEKLYERACALDPHSDAFAQWLSWSRQSLPLKSMAVAKAWHKILPGDIEPLLELISISDRNAAFHQALEYLTKAERIDSLHTRVRNARFRLTARNAMRQIQQRKGVLAEKTLDAVAALPQAQQGDRPALVTAMRYMASVAGANQERAAAYRAETGRLMESPVAASVLIAAVAAGCKLAAFEKLGPAKKLSAAERETLPIALARAATLAKELEIEAEIPWNWMVEAGKQFPKTRDLLTVEQLLTLGEAASRSNYPQLAYAASAAGLQRGGSFEAAFILLRAKALPDPQFVRRAVCAAAAAELARQSRDMAIVDEAIGFLRDELNTDGPPIKLEQTPEVLQKERIASSYPDRRDHGPDYSALAPRQPCSCPDCRRERGESVDSFDEFDDEDLFDEDDEEDFEFPPDMPPEIAKMLFEETKKAVQRGETLDQLFARLMTGRRQPKPKKKSKRN